MRRTGVALFAASVVMLLVALGLIVLGSNDPLTPDVALFPVAYLAFGAVGAVVLVRQPENLIGRLAMTTGFVGAVAGLADSWARVEAVVPGREWAAWLTTWLFPASLALPMLLLLLFPAGRLASRRWRIVVAMLLVGALLVATGNAFTPRMSDHPDLVNPLAIDAFTGSELESGGIGWWPLLAGAVLAACGLVPRLRRASGVEREQMKWITYAAALHGASWLLLAVDLGGVAGQIGTYALFLTLALIPIAAGIAILRYRLYDIDLVIRRTVVYAVLVAVLAAAYVTLVLALQALLSPVTGNDTLPVALSTLATAALFGPVRARVRESVDRRFFRSRYDAQRTLEGFANRLRDEVELESVAAALVGVADRAVAPHQSGLWLRAQEAR